jgi:mannose-6-phosphate isomerase-like protein (cupin superfamily)
MISWSRIKSIGGLADKNKNWRTYMSTQGEKIGSALAKAIKGTSAKMKDDVAATKMYRTNLRDVPKVEGLKRDDGWVDMQVQFLIDKKSAGADHVVGWTVLKPGARHENHRHHNCDEFFIVLKGRGHIYTDEGQAPSGEGDVVYSPRDCWHGFNNTSNEDVVLVWGWMGAGSIEDSGYQVHLDSHK